MGLRRRLSSDRRPSAPHNHQKICSRAKKLSRTSGQPSTIQLEQDHTSMKSSNLVLTSESLLSIDPTVGFLECKECLTADNWDETQRELLDELPVTFSVTFPKWNLEERKTFFFGCRRPSYGCLEDDEDKVQDFDASAVDPNFFDKGYTLAGSTGFCVWAGSRFLLEALLLLTASTDCTHKRMQRLRYYQEQVSNGGMRALELGAGVGLLGTVLASAGAQVLITDLPTLVENAIEPNLYLNNADEQNTADDKTISSSQRCHQKTPTWLVECDNVQQIGEGWAAASPLDWTKPITKQLSSQQRKSINIILASDCLFLADLLDPFLETVSGLFQEGDGGASALLLSFQLRERNIGSALFVTPNHLVEAVNARGWSLVVLGWKPVRLVDGTATQLALVEITPGGVEQ